MKSPHPLNYVTRIFKSGTIIAKLLNKKESHHYKYIRIKALYRFLLHTLTSSTWESDGSSLKNGVLIVLAWVVWGGSCPSVVGAFAWVGWGVSDVLE